MDTLPPVPQLLRPTRDFLSAWSRPGRLADAVLSTDRRRRIRLTQWLVSVLVYAATTGATWIGVRVGLISGTSWLVWTASMAAAQVGFFAAIRSGWSEQFDDPALTAAQIVLGVVSAEWGYVIAGTVRSATLLPLLLIFTFGAFSLDWRRITALTAFALASLVACVAWMHLAASYGFGTARDAGALQVDVANVLMVMILLPATSWLSARLSALRSRLHSQRTALTEALQEVQRLATRDELTGLFNRRHMQERLAQACAHAQRHGQPLSIALIDLDHFKRINDLHGHAAGDEALRAFSREAATGLRIGDVMARWGGEEFLLLLPDARGQQAEASIQRLLARIHALPLVAGAALTFSAGVTEHRAGEPVADTVARADRAMYAAKQSGRDSVLLQ